MKTLLISIIIPAYNVAPYIGRCLESVLCQTYQSLEIIVVDDGSNDDTGAIIDTYAKKDSRIIIIHKENGGVSSARIAGISIAKGDYIGFVDGDDYVEPEMFAKLLENALRYNADISHCGYQMIFPDGHIDYYYNTGRQETHNRIQAISHLVEGKFVEPGLWNKLYRREIVVGFDNEKIWDSSICINEDLLMNYILFSKAESSVYEDIPFYHYILRRGSAATSRVSRQKMLDPLRVMKIILEDTVDIPTLYKISAERYLRVLMSVVQQSYWKEDAAIASIELKLRIREFKKIQCISKKILLMSWMNAYMQLLYKLVRRLYNRCTGVDKKYNIE